MFPAQAPLQMFPAQAPLQNTVCSWRIGIHVVVYTL